MLILIVFYHFFNKMMDKTNLISKLLTNLNFIDMILIVHTVVVFVMKIVAALCNFL